MGIKILMMVALWPVFPVVVLFLSGNWESFLQDEIIPNWWIFALVDFIGVLVAVYFLTRDGTFKYSVSTEKVNCEYPGRPDVSYEVPLKNIDEIKRITRVQHGHNDYFIVDKRGERFLIPQVYQLHIGKVIKAIQKAEPHIQEVGS
jgi:hypothetical protein